MYLITIPFALSIGSNLTNMLAGLNGIESDLGVIWAIGIVFGVLGILVALTMHGILENQTLVNFLKIKEMFYHVGHLL